MVWEFVPGISDYNRVSHSLRTYLLTALKTRRVIYTLISATSSVSGEYSDLWGENRLSRSRKCV